MSANYKDVRPLLAPGSVAIVGASPKEQSWAARIYRNLQRYAFSGQVFPVNPNYAQVWDQKCYQGFRELPSAVDLAVVVIPAEAVLPTLEEAAKAGVRAAVVLSGGFGESGDAEGLKRAERLRLLCAERGISLCGPNCLGLISVPYRVMALTDARIPVLEVGGLSLISQSGGMLGSICRAATDRGLGFSYLISSGNELDTGLADYIMFMCEDPYTKVIVTFVEGIRDPAKFLEASEYAISRGKPIVALKIGRSTRGVAAALAHTGALAGNDAIFDAVCKEKGIIRVNDLDSLLNTADLLLHSKLPQGDRVGFLTFSGGLKGLILDTAEEAGTRLEELSAPSAAEFQQLLPVGTSVGNPLDSGWGGLSSRETYLRCVRILLADPHIDFLAIQEELPRDASRSDKEGNLLALAAIAEEQDKPLAAFSMVSHSVTEYGRSFREKCGLAFLQEVGKSMVSINAAAAYSKALRSRLLSGSTGCAGAGKKSGEEARREWFRAKGPLDELRSKQLLESYGIPFPPTHLARTEEEAVRAAQAVGFPVALKVMAEGLTHKSDAGGVSLNLGSAGEVRQAFQSVYASIKERHPAMPVKGVLIQKMAPSGQEVIIGGLVDPQFGPAVMFGLGGVLVEIYKDVVFRMAPVSMEKALEMVREIKGYRLLQGYRGKPAADEEFLAGILTKLSNFLVDFGDLLSAVEINPFIALPQGQGGVAVDALIISTGACHEEVR